MLTLRHHSTCPHLDAIVVHDHPRERERGRSHAPHGRLVVLKRPGGFVFTLDAYTRPCRVLAVFHAAISTDALPITFITAAVGIAVIVIVVTVTAIVVTDFVIDIVTVIFIFIAKIIGGDVTTVGTVSW